VTVRLPAGRSAKRVTLAGPDHSTDLSLAARQEGNMVRFAVPEVKVYEIAVIEY